MTRIVSSIPGRIRLRDPALRQPDRLERLCAALQAMDGALSVEGNGKAGSVVLYYRPGALAVDAVEAVVEQVVGVEVSTVRVNAAKMDAKSARPRPMLKPSTRVRLNRYAKRGMLVSLPISLALAAAGRKRWHAVSGGAFVACLLVHMAVHRRHLIR